jgi:undecaprenyl diphosphate synthase
VQVEYYGSIVPLSQVANVALLDARTISVQPWEKGMGAKIEKAIRESDLGLNPASMGDLIRVPMPPMSEERRKEMTKLARNEGESAKIAVRNLRRDANESVKKLVKDKLASEDDQKRAETRCKSSPTSTSPRSIAGGGQRTGNHGGLSPDSRRSSFYMSVPLVVPHHIAIVMDGNGRWATRRFLPRLAGHKQGVDSLRRCARACVQRGVAVLTVFAFSSENWNRPVDEVSGLMELLAMALAREVPQLKKDGVRVCFVGERAGLSPKVRDGLAQAEAATAENTRLVLNVCFNYGGRWDIAQAAASLAARGEPITEASLNGAMALAHVLDPDLVIRTGGEMRISNFLLWQAAYSELFFSDRLWPDFDESALDEAIAAFNGRERRFGKTSEQILSAHPAPVHG